MCQLAFLFGNVRHKPPGGDARSRISLIYLYCHDLLLNVCPAMLYSYLEYTGSEVSAGAAPPFSLGNGEGNAVSEGRHGSYNWSAQHEKTSIPFCYSL